MRRPVATVSSCEILIGQLQADAFDCPCKACDVYIHVLTFAVAVPHSVFEVI